VMDFFFHAQLVDNPGMPAWWPAFCGAYDLAAAGYLTWRLTLSRPDTRQAPNAYELGSR
jgi:hypothetical protein